MRYFQHLVIRPLGSETLIPLGRDHRLRLRIEKPALLEYYVQDGWHAVAIDSSLSPEALEAATRTLIPLPNRPVTIRETDDGGVLITIGNDPGYYFSRTASDGPLVGIHPAL